MLEMKEKKEKPILSFRKTLKSQICANTWQTFFTSMQLRQTIRRSESVSLILIASKQTLPL